ncbi:unnamed protein product [Caenorhabditis brenneri]
MNTTLPPPVHSFSILNVIENDLYPLLLRCSFTGALIMIAAKNPESPRLSAIAICLLVMNVCIDGYEMIEFNAAGETLLKVHVLFTNACKYGGGAIGEGSGITGFFGSIIGAFGGEAARKIVQGCSWIVSRYF